VSAQHGSRISGRAL